MEILFLAGVAPIVEDPDGAATFYRDHLGVPLETVMGDYRATDALGHCRHFGVWPLADAAEACFGSREWPADVAVPQCTIEFEVADVAAAAAELEGEGHSLIHGERTEPWGQAIARLLSPDGLLIGLSHFPDLHD